MCQSWWRCSKLRWGGVWLCRHKMVIEQAVFGIEAETMEKMEVLYYLVTVKRLAGTVGMTYLETYPETMAKDMTEMAEASKDMTEMAESNETINPMEMAEGMACWNRWAS